MRVVVSFKILWKQRISCFVILKMWNFHKFRKKTHISNIQETIFLLIRISTSSSDLKTQESIVSSHSVSWIISVTKDNLVERMSDFSHVSLLVILGSLRVLFEFWCLNQSKRLFWFDLNLISTCVCFLNLWTLTNSTARPVITYCFICFHKIQPDSQIPTFSTQIPFRRCKKTMWTH